MVRSQTPARLAYAFMVLKQRISVPVGLVDASQTQKALSRRRGLQGSDSKSARIFCSVKTSRFPLCELADLGYAVAVETMAVETLHQSGAEC
jgi:hypothetical protein